YKEVKDLGLIERLFGKTDNKKMEEFISAIFSAKKKQLEIKRHAIEHAIDIIAKTISKSEIQVYRLNSKTGKVQKEENDLEYYKLNIRPNVNETATSFFYKVIKKYLEEEEALIVCLNNDLYLADSFIASQNILLPKTYSNVQISDDQGNTI